jgi:hypothetical protein
LMVSISGISTTMPAPSTEPYSINPEATPAAEQKRVVIAYSYHPEGKKEGDVTLTASAARYESAMIVIPVVSRTAKDVEGFRVTIDSQADGALIGFGKKQVKVHVTRLNSVAYPWTRFQSLRVALRDTISDVTAAGAAVDGAPGDIYSLTATNFADEMGVLFLLRILLLEVKELLQPTPISPM